MANETGADVLAHVGANLRRLRGLAGASQTTLAERSGISRRTIIKLEAGEANISLSGLDDLAHALGVTFIDLVAAPTATRASIHEVAWRGATPASVATLLGSAPATHEAQLWTWALGAGERYDAEPDPAGWHEMLLVTTGVLTLELADGHRELTLGERVVFPSDHQYAYVNEGDAVVEFVRVVVS